MTETAVEKAGSWGDVGRFITGAGRPVRMPPDLAKAFDDKYKDDAAGVTAGNALTYGPVGGGLAGAVYLAKRLAEPNAEEEEKEIQKRNGPILALSSAVKKKPAVNPVTPVPATEAAPPEAQAAPVDADVRVWNALDGVSKVAAGEDVTTDYSKHSDVEWFGPAQIAAGVGGTLGGYMLIRHLIGKLRKSELDSEREEAEKSYTKAVSSALRPVGLGLTPTKKFASIHELSDEDACMVAIDSFIKQSASGLAATLQRMGWWSALLAAPIAGMGATMGWNLSAKGNKARKELTDIKRRRILAALNAPTSPIVTVQGKVPEHWQDPDDESQEKAPGLAPESRLV